MPAGLGNVSTRNFVKEFVHKITCGNSLIKTAVINGDLFDASSGVYRGAVNYSTATSADTFMPQSIEVGVLGVTTALDAMPTDGTNNLPGTFRVGDTTGIQKGSIVHVVESTGAVTTATGSITFAGVAVAPGTCEVTLTNSATGAVTTSAALAIPAGNANASAASLTTEINGDATISPLVVATNPAAPSPIVVLTATQPGVLGNMGVGTADVGLAPQATTPVDITGGAPNVGTASISHVHRSGSITIQDWVTDPDFLFLPGSIVVASASGSPSEAIVDTKVSSSAGDSAVSGQYIAALLRAFEDVTVSGGVVAPTGAGTATTFTVSVDAATQFVPDSMIGNTITFDDIPTVAADLRGVSRTIISNTATDITVRPPLPAAPVVADTFVLTATQLDDQLNALMSSPGDVDSAGVVGGNTGAPAGNSNAAPVPALAYMAAYRFGLLLNGGPPLDDGDEPNIMLSSKVLSDMAGLGMTVESLPHYPLVGDHAAGSSEFSVRLPSNVGDRAIPRSGRCILQQDQTTGVIFNDTRRDPAVAGAIGNPSFGFVRDPVDANGISVVTLTGGAVSNFDFDSNARVYLFTAAMNGPQKHGFSGEVKSADYMSVLASCVKNMLDYTVPAP